MKANVRCLLVILLCVLAGVTAWVWFRPYSWRQDAGARYHIEAAKLRRDYENYWLEVFLKPAGSQGHDPFKPVELITAQGKRLVPVDVTLGGVPRSDRPEEIYIKFWLEAADLDGKLQLKLNEGELEVKSGAARPQLENGASRIARTSNW